MFPLSLEQSLSDTLKQAIFNSAEGIRINSGISIPQRMPAGAAFSKKAGDAVVMQQPLSTGKNILFCDATDENDSEIWLNFGDAYERFTASEFLQNDMVVDTPDRLGDTAIPVDEFVLTKDLLATATDAAQESSQSKPISWVQAHELFSTHTKLIPSEFVWPSRLESASHKAQFSRVNTGMAAGESVEHAQLCGLYDVVEQDAFITHWLLRHTPGRISLKWVEQHSKRVAKLTSEKALTIDLLWLMTDLNIPCVMSIIRSERKDVLSVGISCDLDALTACEKAIFKAYNSFNWTLAMKQSGLGALDEGKIESLWDHVRFYLDPDNHQHIDFLLDGPLVPEEQLSRYRYPPLSYETQLKDARHRIGRQGYRIWSVSINKPDFLSVGISVNKIVVPGLQPILVGAQKEYADKKRVSQVAGHLGIPMPRTLNEAVHPFL